ncbi:putative GTP binding domain, P-loop containing nucleoside triphosphate hydrolase [Helianthus annuus]|nr:putative GTP binding domain, P-loop containing nucleoside triphosphate hydrolase [Helianthus annuus]
MWDSTHLCKFCDKKQTVSARDDVCDDTRDFGAVEFSKVDTHLLPTVLLIGRPNVGKSALFNRLIRRREALVYNTPSDHVTRDIREGIAKLGDLRFKVLDSASLEAEASSGSVLGRTAEMTANVLRKCHCLNNNICFFKLYKVQHMLLQILQLAFVGRPNVGNSTLLNAILQEERVLVGLEAGLTRDSVRVEFKYQGRTIYMVI